MAGSGTRGTAQEVLSWVRSPLLAPLRESVLVHLVDSTWHPRSGREDGGCGCWEIYRCFRSRAAAQEAWVKQASSDVLPVALMSKQARLGGDVEWSSDTGSHPLSARTPGSSRKRGGWGMDLVHVGKPGANSAGETERFQSLCCSNTGGAPPRASAASFSGISPPADTSMLT